MPFRVPRARPPPRALPLTLCPSPCPVPFRVPRARQVHWVYPFERLKAINVTSTVDCLRLATLGPALIPVNFVSSTSVFDCDHYILRSERVREDDDLAGGTGLTVGYGN